MGVLDKFLDVMRLNPEDEDDDFYDDDFYDDEPPVTRKSSRKDKNDDYDESHSIKEKPAKQAQKITPMRPAKRQSAGGMEVCVIKPTSVEDAREIADDILQLYENEHLRIAYGIAGRKFVDREFEINHCFKKIEKIYEKYNYIEKNIK